MDAAVRRRLYNRCNPDEALEPGDERRVDFDAFGPSRVQVRGASWTEGMAVRFESSDAPLCRLFTGLRGSGKTTELNLLAHRLRERGLFPVQISADEGIDLTEPVDVADVLITVLEGTERAVLAAEGEDPDRAFQEGFLGRIWDWLGSVDVPEPRLELGTPSAAPVQAKLSAELKTTPSLREKARRSVATRLSTFLNEVRKALAALQDRLEAKGHGRLVILFDALEKLQGTSSNWKDVIQSAEQLFAGGAPHLRLPVHVLYTVPPALLLRLVAEVEFLPMIKLADRASQEPYADGYAAAKDLVYRRVEKLEVRALFGDDYDAQLERLIAWSGGYPRDIVRILQAVIVEGELPVDRPKLERLLTRSGDAYRRIIGPEHYAWLADLARTKRLAFSDGQRESVDRLLQNTVILRYLNDGEWYDLHPAVKQIPEIQALLGGPA